MTTKELTNKVIRVIEEYKKSYPEINLGSRDYLPFKVSEEWGECIKAYLMISDRGRQKGLGKEEIKGNLSEEIADTFGYLLAFAAQEGIDIEQALTDKWFKYLDK